MQPENGHGASNDTCDGLAADTYATSNHPVITLGVSADCDKRPIDTTPTVHAEDTHDDESGVEDDHHDHHDGSTVFDHSEASRPTQQHPLSRQVANTIWLIPASLTSVDPPLLMECIYRGPGAFTVHWPIGDQGSDRAAPSSIGSADEVLWRYHGRIASILVDVSSVPNPDEEETIAPPLELPFCTSPMPMPSWPCQSRDSGSLPLLWGLTDIQIFASREVSSRSLLELLRYTPSLQKLSIKNSVQHQAIRSEELGLFSAIRLPYLESVTLKGVSAETANELLSRISMRMSTRMEIYLKPACPSGPIGALHDMLATIPHACLSYTRLECREKGGWDRYLFSFSDIDSRVQIHWDWSVAHGDPPNLLHVSLDRAALRNVRQLTVSLRDVSLLPGLGHRAVAVYFLAAARPACHATRRSRAVRTLVSVDRLPSPSRMVAQEDRKHPAYLRPRPDALSGGATAWRCAPRRSSRDEV
ncbi:hypothetical protein BN946_scf184746.g7 [Trametes cinnabarina]|uniref:F-box domain-containing protein n=1 Tax=Pycnoporus cinnabarinus TaxID=5643 RepID=A0A060S598_PYCCI|nr:hypothetical protein BN946_scf184746.g7 [Trametes cinnabarina]